MTPDVTGFFETVTSSIAYVVGDPEARRCAVIDAVLDYDRRSGRTATRSADVLITHARERGWSVDWVLDTHVHADHMTALSYLKDRLGGRSGIGGSVGVVQRTFRDIYGIDLACDGSQYDHLFADGEDFQVGTIPGRALHVPGHTPACTAYHIGDALFVGDTLLMPDFGTARCDFPGGDAAALYRSVRRLLGLPPETRLFVGHDYGPGGRPAAWQTTVAEQRRGNIHIRDAVPEDEFVRLRQARDATLELPELMLAAIQVNIRAGRLPEPDAAGRRWLKIPLNRF